MDTNGGIKVFLGGSQSNGHVIALCYLTSIGTEHMEPYYTLLREREKSGPLKTDQQIPGVYVCVCVCVCVPTNLVGLVADQFAIACVVPSLGHSELQRSEVGVVHL